MLSAALSRPAALLLTTFGLGRLRPAPGTWGSLPPCAIALLLAALGFAPPHPLYFAALAAILVLFSLSCVLLGHRAEAHFNRHDPGDVCADETAGMCIPLLALPPHLCTSVLTLLPPLLAAFLLFRAFDILKPWPAGALQRIPGGWGILLDDLAAGVMAAIVLAAALALLMG